MGTAPADRGLHSEALSATALEITPERGDIQQMTAPYSRWALAAIVLFLGAGTAEAQIAPPINGPVNPALIVPLPTPPPPPRIEVPAVPKMDEIPAPRNTAPRRSSFGDRVNDCLQDGVAARLGPSDREAYSRSCANR